jgi:hypothetical protein
VYWNNINAAAACTGNSTVYENWSGPLGYCSKSTPTTPIYTPPNQPIDTQGLIITSCVFLAFAAIAGSFDACAESGSTNLAKFTTAWSALAMIMLICSFSLWVTFQWVTLVVSYDGFYIPVWLNPYENILSAVPVCTWFALLSMLRSSM